MSMPYRDATPVRATARLVVTAVALIRLSCGGPAPDDQQGTGTGAGEQPSGPVSIEWTDGDFEKNAHRIGYGQKPDSILSRDAAGVLVFTPETPEDHVATPFNALQRYDGSRSLELTLDMSSAGGDNCAAHLQDQAFNVLAIASCRNSGEQRATAKVPRSVTAVRVYFLSADRQPLRLPTRMRLLEHR